MAQRSRATLKGYFNAGDIPTETNFADMIDSAVVLAEDGAAIVSAIDGEIGSGWKATAEPGASTLVGLTDVPDTPSEGDILVYRTDTFVYEAKPASGSNPALNDVSNVTLDAPADNEVLAYDSATSTWVNQTAAEAGLAQTLHTHDVSDVSGAIPSDPSIFAGFSAVTNIVSGTEQDVTDAQNASVDLTGVLVVSTE